MSVDPIWYYEKNRERVGPVSAEEIVARLSSGELSSATLLWRMGFANWTPLAQTEFAPVLTQLAQSAPPQPAAEVGDVSEPEPEREPESVQESESALESESEPVAESSSEPTPASGPEPAPAVESAPEPASVPAPASESPATETEQREPAAAASLTMEAPVAERPQAPLAAAQPSTPFVPRTARLRAGFVPSIRGSFGRAWTLLRSRLWPILGAYLVISILIGVASQLVLPTFFIVLPLMGGFFWYILKYLRGEQVSIELLFEGCRRQFGSLAILNLLMSGVGTVILLVLWLPLIGGLAFLGLQGGEFDPQSISPPIMALMIGGALLVYGLTVLIFSLLGFVAMFATLLILDCEVKVGQALSLGWRVTKQHLPKFLAFMVVHLALSLLGTLAFFVGVIVTTVWSTIAFTFIYEDAFGERASTRAWERARSKAPSTSDDLF